MFLHEDGHFPPVREDEQDWGEWKNGVMGEWRDWEVASLPTRREDEESVGGVGTWARTDSPATPTTTQQ